MRSKYWQLGNLGTISAFACRHRETKENLCRGGRTIFKLKLMSHFLQTAIDKTPYSLNLIKCVVETYSSRFFNVAFLAEQEELNSEASCIVFAEEEKTKPEGGGSDSQVVVVAVHRNPCCFDVSNL